jgi:hypothetical protein
MATDTVVAIDPPQEQQEEHVDFACHVMSKEIRIREVYPSAPHLKSQFSSGKLQQLRPVEGYL